MIYLVVDVVLMLEGGAFLLIEYLKERAAAPPSPSAFTEMKNKKQSNSIIGKLFKKKASAQTDQPPKESKSLIAKLFKKKPKKPKFKVKKAESLMARFSKKKKEEPLTLKDSLNEEKKETDDLNMDSFSKMAEETSAPANDAENQNVKANELETSSIDQEYDATMDNAPSDVTDEALEKKKDDEESIFHINTASTDGDDKKEDEEDNDDQSDVGMKLRDL